MPENDLDSNADRTGPRMSSRGPRSRGADHAANAISRFRPAGAALCLLLAVSACKKDEAPTSEAAEGADAPARAEAAAEAEAARPLRVVTLGGAITETVVALGAADSIVAIDDSSAEVEETADRPKVGYYRSVGAEGILSLEPTLVIGTTDAGPPPALAQLRGARVPLVLAPSDATVEGARARIEAVAKALGKEKEGEALIASLDRELDEAKRALEEKENKPKVLFLFAPGQNVLSASGSGTAAAEILELAGAENAVSGYEGYKPLSAEAAITAAPDVILLTTSTLQRMGGIEGVLALPGLGQTPAGTAKRVIALDDLYLLGFGPRTGNAVKTLSEQLYAAVK